MSPVFFTLGSNKLRSAEKSAVDTSTAGSNASSGLIVSKSIGVINSLVLGSTLAFEVCSNLWSSR